METKPAVNVIILITMITMTIFKITAATTIADKYLQTTLTLE